MTSLPRSPGGSDQNDDDYNDNRAHRRRHRRTTFLHRPDLRRQLAAVLGSWHARALLAAPQAPAPCPKRITPAPLAIPASHRPPAPQLSHLLALPDPLLAHIVRALAAAADRAALARLLRTCRRMYAHAAPALYTHLAFDLSFEDGAPPGRQFRRDPRSDLFRGTHTLPPVFFAASFQDHHLARYALACVQTLQIKLTRAHLLRDLVGGPRSVFSACPNLRSLAFYGVDYTNVDVVKLLLLGYTEDDEPVITTPNDYSLDQLCSVHLHDISMAALVDLMPLISPPPPSFHLHQPANTRQKSLTLPVPPLAPPPPPLARLGGLVATLSVQFSAAASRPQDLCRLAHLLAPESLPRLADLALAFDADFDLADPALPNLFRALFASIVGAQSEEGRPLLRRLRVYDFPPYLDVVPYLELIGAHSVRLARSSTLNSAFEFTFHAASVENEACFMATLHRACAFRRLSLVLGACEASFFLPRQQTSVLGAALRHLVLDGPRALSRVDCGAETVQLPALRTLVVANAEEAALIRVVSVAPRLASLVLLSLAAEHEQQLHEGPSVSHALDLLYIPPPHAHKWHRLAARFPAHSLCVAAPAAPRTLLDHAPADPHAPRVSGAATAATALHAALADPDDYALFLSHLGDALDAARGAFPSTAGSEETLCFMHL